MSDSQSPAANRVPAGVPTGGQFAASARAESGVTLDPTVDHRRETPTEDMGRTACMDFLNPRRMHPVLADRIVSAEYGLDSLRDLVARVRDYDAEHGPWEPPGRSAIDAYTEEAEAVRIEHRVLTEGFDRLDPVAQEERRVQVAEHYEHVAREAANRIEPQDLPNPGRVRLSGLFGRVRGAAEASATEHIAAHGAVWRYDTVEARADALIEKVLDTRDFTAANGVPFRARLVRRGTAWGRDGSLTAERDMVFFFDARYPDHDPMIGHATEDRAATERNGQFVANYAVETLRDHRPGAGLNLDGGIDDWTIDGDTYDQVLDWMDRRAPLRDNKFGSAGSPEDLNAAAERDLYAPRPGRIDLAEAARASRETNQAYATRAREIARGWDSVAD